MCIDETNTAASLLVVSAVSFVSFSFVWNGGFGDEERIVLIINISLNSDAICFIFLRFRTLANNFIDVYIIGEEDKHSY